MQTDYIHICGAVLQYPVNGVAFLILTAIQVNIFLIEFINSEWLAIYTFN